MLAPGMASALVFPSGQCIVPANLTGPVAIYVTNSSTPLSGDVTSRTTDSVVGGPTMAFLDPPPSSAPPQALSAAVASGFSAGVAPSGGDSSSPAASAGASPAVADPASASKAGVPSPDGPSPDGSLTVLGATQVPA